MPSSSLEDYNQNNWTLLFERLDKSKRYFLLSHFEELKKNRYINYSLNKNSDIPENIELNDRGLLYFEHIYNDKIIEKKKRTREEFEKYVYEFLLFKD